MNPRAVVIRQYLPPMRGAPKALGVFQKITILAMHSIVVLIPANARGTPNVNFAKVQ